jgi:hypothetical protein
MTENTSYVTVRAAPLKAVTRAIIGRTGHWAEQCIAAQLGLTRSEVNRLAGLG